MKGQIGRMTDEHRELVTNDRNKSDLYSHNSNTNDISPKGFVAERTLGKKETRET